MRWIYQDLGVLLDTVFIFLQDKIPENSDDVGVVAVFLYGLGDVPLSIITSMPATPAVIVGNTLIVVPELSRLLRYSTIVASTEGISLVVLAAIDGVFYTAPTVASFVGSVTAAAPVPELALASPQPGSLNRSLRPLSLFNTGTRLATSRLPAPRFGLKSSTTCSRRS